MEKVKKIFVMLTIVICILGAGKHELQAATVEQEVLLLDATTSISEDDAQNMKYALTAAGILGIMALITEVLENNKKNNKTA